MDHRSDFRARKLQNYQEDIGGNLYDIEFSKYTTKV